VNRPTMWERPRRSDSHVVIDARDGAVVQVDTAVLQLNATAFALWELCDGRTTLDEMVMAVCQLFDIGPDQATHDVTLTIGQMREVGLLT
jgi:hypothetical protein